MQWMMLLGSINQRCTKFHVGLFNELEQELIEKTRLTFCKSNLNCCYNIVIDFNVSRVSSDVALNLKNNVLHEYVCSASGATIIIRKNMFRGSHL